MQRFFSISGLVSWPVYRFVLFTLCIFSTVGGVSADRIAPALTLEQYLEQVKQNHSGIQGAFAAVEAGELRSEEGQRLLRPTAFANMRLMSDGKLQPNSMLAYDNVIANSYSVGMSQLTPVGLQAKLHYDLYTQYFNHPNFYFSLPGVDSSSLVPLSYTNASPVLEITQNLWSNGFGRATRAIQTETEAAALGSSYSARFQIKQTLAEAEAQYWKLAIARQILSIQQEALDRSKKIYAWYERRTRLHLSDASDLLQAEALQKTRELYFMNAQNEERILARNFNSSRNQDSDQVPEKLMTIDSDQIENLSLPKSADIRDDVRAAEQKTRQVQASAQIAIERDYPVLDVFASFALNGQQGNTAYSTLSDSMSHSFSFSRPTKVIGIQFSAPLDIGLNQRSRAGWRRESAAAELQQNRKRFEQEESWKTLVTSFLDAKKRFLLAHELEKIQQKKLSQEKIRLTHGRSSTYQVLLFEQDYLLAQLERAQCEMTILLLRAQSKIFGETL